MEEIHAFLSAYNPKSICLPCLAVVTGRSDADVTKTVNKLVSSRHAMTNMGECLNCASRGIVVRVRGA